MGITPPAAAGTEVVRKFWLRSPPDGRRTGAQVLAEIAALQDVEVLVEVLLVVAAADLIICGRQV